MTGEIRTPREGGGHGAASCACRRPSAKPAASRSTSSARARWRSVRRAASRRRRDRARRDRAGPRVAVDDRVPASAARRKRAALRSRVTVMRYTPQAVLDRQRRGGALPRARRRGRQPARRGALCRAQQPAQLPEGDAAAASPRCGARRWRPADPAGRRRAKAPCCCRSRRAAPARTRRPSSSSSSTCSATSAWIDKGIAQRRSPGARSARLAHRLSLHHSPRFASSPGRDVPPRRRSRAVVRGAVESSARLPRRPNRQVGLSPSSDLKDLLDKLQEGSRPDDGRRDSGAGAFSATRALGFPGRGADRGNAVPFPRD